MANLQVKNIPAALHRQLQQEARREGRTIRDLVLEAVRRDLRRRTFREQWSKRKPVALGHPANTALSEARAERERELGP